MSKITKVGLHLAFAIGAIGTMIPVPALAGGDPFDNAKKEHWGVVARNTIGSPVAALRSGPFVPGPSGEPPFGKGSLGIEVAAVPGHVEKVDFGNEVDFFGTSLSALSNVGFHVFQTGENASPARGGPTNMPNIRIEILSSGTAGYTTMVWNPGPSPVVNRWSEYIDGTSNGAWYFTGSVGATSGCSDSNPPCSFATAKSKFPAATILSVAVGKGRDNLWVGAVDGLRLNDTIYDFEADDVKKKNAKN